MDHIEMLEGRVRFDIAREARTGFPEAVLAIGKTSEDLAGILRSVVPKKQKILVTKLDREKMQEVEELLHKEDAIPKGVKLMYHQVPRLLVVRTTGGKSPDLGCKVGVVAGGTSDMPVAEEARLVCQESGIKTLKAYDVGVAGLHRLFSPLKEMIESDVDVVIVVAGMEGALPSVVKGLVAAPVIGVPTSIGYGYRAGESALIAMLNSCVPGLLVVNVDNGFGAGAAAYMICKRISDAKAKG